MFGLEYIKLTFFVVMAFAIFWLVTRFIGWVTK